MHICDITVTAKFNQLDFQLVMKKWFFFYLL